MEGKRGRGKKGDADSSHLQVESRISQVRQAKRLIEQETVRDAQQMIDRLSSDEMQRLSVLQAVSLECLLILIGASPYASPYNLCDCSMSLQPV